MAGRKYNYYHPEYNEFIDLSYELQQNTRIGIGVIVGLGAAVGTLAGLGLSFTALSPLVIGGVVGAISVASLALAAAGLRYCYRDKINEWKKKEGFVEKRIITAVMPFFLFGAIVSIATGVCLAAATNVVLPGVFTTWWAIAAGAGIGAIALSAGVFAGKTVGNMFAGSVVEDIMPDQSIVGLNPQRANYNCL